MKINIRFIDKCPKNVYGTTEILNNKTILINISRLKNQNKSEFFVTMLHELLHAWMFILKANDIHMSPRTEHKWIYLVQNSVVRALNKIKRR